MKKRLITLLSLSVASLIVACGVGETTSGNLYYSASNSAHYVIESGINNQSESQLYISMVTQASLWKAPLESVPSSIVGTTSYTYNQNGISGTVTLRGGILGISYTSTNGAWIDFAAIESHIGSSIPNGNYNLICDQANLSPCTMVVQTITGVQVVTVTEFNTVGTATTLCSNSPITQSGQSNPMNPYLYSFTCSNSGGTTSGVWDLLPFTQHGVTGFMVAENNYSSNITDDSTDEIAFPQHSISPTGSYNYLYNGGIGIGIGVNTASFSLPSGINNPTSLCSNCGLTLGRYYNGVAATGFAWYTPDFGISN
ncbi:MAG: hypothetical protein PHC75_09545 [Burkholderiales bacterium]|nr:hypothetical protein [Burkholderiales bacterium]